MIRGKRIITLEDFNRLVDLIGPVGIKQKNALHTDQLFKVLQDAEQVNQHEIDKDIITMNSKALLRSLSNGRQAELTLTYPLDADPIKSRISVLSHIGIALIGSKSGDVVTWKTPLGWGQFCVEEILYQPEAAKEFQL